MESLLALPRWVYVGMSVGALVSFAVAVTFLVAPRLFPDRGGDRGPRLSSEERRRREIGRYLEAIGESYREDAEVGGRTVAFYLPERDVAVTFDARTFYSLEPTPTHPVLVEHEMPGASLGHRLPFETPESPFGADDGGVGSLLDDGPVSAGVDSVEAAFAELGLPSGADEEAVRRAYRARIKEVHPDHGGDEAAFRRVREAYRRAREHAA